MPRQIRLEFKGAIYHVINRGNYRSDVFASDGAKLALLTALGETAQKLNWRVHAWAIMSNHYHVALETPRGNLVEGMKHWQATFATRIQSNASGTWAYLSRSLQKPVGGRRKTRPALPLHSPQSRASKDVRSHRSQIMAMDEPALDGQTKPKTFLV